METIKKCLKSWTIWFNTTGIALLSIAMLEPSLLEWLNTNNFSYLIVVGNILLRFKTKSSVIK